MAVYDKELGAWLLEDGDMLKLRYVRGCVCSEGYDWDFTLDATGVEVYYWDEEEDEDYKTHLIGERETVAEDDPRKERLAFRK